MSNKKYQLPKEFAERWVKALRSGKYQQATGSLKTKSGYCCLGVACKIKGARIADLKDHEWIERKGCIDPIVLEKIPDLLKGDSRENEFVKIVADMNDRGKTFTVIADYIEQEVEFI